MGQKQKRRGLLILGLLIISAGEGLACRYNIRETGFVDLGTDAYRLFCFVDTKAGGAEISQVRSLAAEVLAENPVSLEVIAVDDTPDHPAMDYWKPVDAASQSSAVLVSPLGHSLSLGPLWGDPFSADEVREALREVLSSPVRTRIAAELATAFAVVLLIEGKDQVANSQARAGILQAIETLESELEYFPKPISRGPVLITLPREDLASERVLLWSFDLEYDDLVQPVASILYGRGRWIGPIMTGDQITLDLVTRILFVVGADCECNLDPRMIRGTGIPIPWNRELQSLVSRDLGFDPDNPLVRMEVGQILQMHSGRSFTPEMRSSEIPPRDGGAGQRAGSLFTRQLLYLLGGLAALVLTVGTVLWIRAERERR